MIFYIFWSTIMNMRVKSYLGLKFNFSQSSNLELKNTDKNVSLSLPPPPPPPFSLLSKISLIKAANTYFSHIRSFFLENKPQGTQRRSSSCLSCAKLINKIFSQSKDRWTEFIRFCGFLYKFILFKRRETVMIWK